MKFLIFFSMMSFLMTKNSFACRPGPVDIEKYAQVAANYLYENEDQSIFRMFKVQLIDADRRGPILSPQCPFPKESFAIFEFSYNSIVGKYDEILSKWSKQDICKQYQIVVSSDQETSIEKSTILQEACK